MSPSQPPGNADDIWFHYKLTSPEGRVREFHVHLDPDTLGLTTKGRPGYPDWTRLTYHQCANCPLRPEEHPRGPVAANLVEVVECFREDASCEETDVEVTTANRTYANHVPLQVALSGLVGIYMVTSGCPHLDKLRPMVHSHLPFATWRETTYRAVSMYWLAQLFRKQHGMEPDWELEGLARIYEEIMTTNSCFRLRVADVQVADAGMNALVRLDFYAQFTNRLLLRKSLGQIERFFRPYLEG